MILLLMLQEKVGDSVNAMLQEESIYYIQTDTDYLPCLIMQVDISEYNEIPQHPIDKNVNIIDNIILGGKKVNLSIVIDYDNFNLFQELLKEGNLSENGFIINVISDYFFNMRCIGWSYTESSENVGSVYATIEFIESKLVESKTSFIDYKKVPSNPQSASKVQNGKIIPKDLPKPKHDSLAFNFLS